MQDPRGRADLGRAVEDAHGQRHDLHRRQSHGRQDLGRAAAGHVPGPGHDLYVRVVPVQEHGAVRGRDRQRRHLATNAWNPNMNALIFVARARHRSGSRPRPATTASRSRAPSSRGFSAASTTSSARRRPSCRARSSAPGRCPPQPDLRRLLPRHQLPALGRTRQPTAAEHSSRPARVRGRLMHKRLNPRASSADGLDMDLNTLLRTSSTRTRATST